MKRLSYVIIATLIAMPLSACVSGAKVISGFGDLRDAEGNPRPSPHSGADVWGPPGSPVLAAADGRVIAIGTEAEPGSCGYYVTIQHPDDSLATSTRYCHLRDHAVTVDQLVKRGEVIGTIGTTGWTRTPLSTTGFEHVHWELSRPFRIDPVSITVGCFDPKRTYPADSFVLTYPVQCKN